MKRKSNKIWRLAFLIVADSLSVVISMLLAYFTTADDTAFSAELVAVTGGNILVTVACFAAIGLYSIIFSSVGVVDAVKLSFSVVALGLVNIIFAAVTNGRYYGIGTALVYSAFLFYLTGISRFSKRIVRIFLNPARRNDKNKKRVMIVGGGEAGLAIIRELQTSDKVAYKPVCVMDDNYEKLGKTICNVKVAGTTYDIKKYTGIYRVDEIFITMPSVDKKRLSKIVARCKDAGKPVKILPGIYQIANGQFSVENLRKVDVSDLLGREQVSVNLDEIMGYIENKVVLVTGGGGSIGSELCRQIATHRPKQLIILDIYENNAYDIQQELLRNHPDLNLLVLIASVRDASKIDDVFRTYRPQIVFHAAAHKHVPLMETSPCEAVKNNVFGTLHVAHCADKYQVQTFVQISTDKAVNPTNVMGATKRICEMIVQTIGKHSEHTKFVAVRFGNVLGSNGSVIPLFKKQIEEGGPVTVTHKDIIRYFMTIPEAVSLVLQAGCYAKEGQIFVLNMGEPVRIYDLAVNLIKLSGYEPGVNMDIVCTGLRPGEKLYEERLMDEEGLEKTPNGLISVAKPIPLDEIFLWESLTKLYEEAYAETDKMKEFVAALVPTYHIDREHES